MPNFLTKFATCCLALMLASPIVACHAQGAAVLAYPRAPGDMSNPDFTSVKVNGAAIETCGTAMNVGYARLACSGAVKVEITAREVIHTFDVSPHRAGIVAKADGDKLSFALAEPLTLHIQVNKLSRFFLFAEAPEQGAPRLGQPGVFDLTSFGVASSPDTVQTPAIQHAIDVVAARGGVLCVPPGIYRAGELRMKSNLTLYLAAGAILKGTGDLADYPPGEFGTQFIYFLDCDNVRILGRGVIDGQGRALRLAAKNAPPSRIKLIRALRAHHVTLQDVILRDSGTWGVHLIESEDVHISGCKLISNTKLDDPSFPWEPNTDGFDPDNSSRVLIEHCFVSSNDDSIAVKLRYGKRRDVGDIVFRQNVTWTVKSALKIGSEVYDCVLSNVRFENNDVIHADRGMVASAYCGATLENIAWIGNHFEFIGGDIKPMAMEIKILNVEGRSLVRDVLIQNNVFEGEAGKFSRLQGLDPEHNIAGVTIDNLIVAGKKCLSAEDARIEIKPHVTGVTFR